MAKRGEGTSRHMNAGRWARPALTDCTCPQSRESRAADLAVHDDSGPRTGEPRFGEEDLSGPKEPQGCFGGDTARGSRAGN